MPEVQKFYLREWLNKKEGRAYVIVDAEESDPKDKYYYSDCMLELGDCNRSINLDFGFDSEEKRLDRIEKVESLKKYLDKIQYFLESIVVPEKEPEE